MRPGYTRSWKPGSLMGNLSDLTEAEAFRLLYQVRFASTEGRPTCPLLSCGSQRVTSFKDGTFRCRACHRDFAITTNTIWMGSRLSSKLILRFTANFSLAANGWAAEEFAAGEGLSPQVASINLHKLREAMGYGNEHVILSGKVELDSAYFGRYHRDHNYKKMRVDKRSIVHPREQLLCAVRERNGRVLTQITKSEAEFIPFVRAHVHPDATVYTDESANWIKLGETFTVKTINHKVCYAWGDVRTNSVERFFSRCRCAERGVYINMTGPNFDLFAQELGFRETYHALSPSERFLLVLSLSLRHPPSRRFGGYWQRVGTRAVG